MNARVFGCAVFAFVIGCSIMLFSEDSGYVDEAGPWPYEWTEIPDYMACDKPYPDSLMSEHAKPYLEKTPKKISSDNS